MKKDAIPIVHPPRRIAFTLKDRIQKELERMEKLGVIVQVDEGTEWVNSMAVVEKPGKLRLCLDPSSLNKVVVREHTTLPTVEETLAKLTNARYFSKLDAKDGYWQVPLTTRSSYYTTFNTPFGRYRYTRLPFGINSANEVFHKRMSQIYDRLPGVIVMHDDILVYGASITEHNDRLVSVFDRSRQKGVKLNKGKCRFNADKIIFMGHQITRNGIQMDPEKVHDILNMPRPTDKTGVQRLLGMLNFLNKHIPNLSQLTQPIRTLLDKRVEFVWTFEHDEAIDKIKTVLSSDQVLAFYDINNNITLSCDASKDGLGSCILQDNRPISYASRSLTKCQKQYAQIEKELLAIVFGCERFHQYLYGKEVLVQTDHKPLINMLKKPLHTTPARIQRLLIRLQRYNLKLTYVPGKFMYIADCLSRAFCTTNLSESDKNLESEAELMIHSVVENVNCSKQMMHKIKAETANDDALKLVKYYIMNGSWPKYVNDCGEPAKLYWSMRDELSLYQEIVLYNDRIVIPRSLRTELLHRIHEGHQGREKCKSLARRVIYWKGMSADIDNFVNRCEACLSQRNAPPREPILRRELPNRAWEVVAVDIFSYGGIKYQIITDYFSKWPEICRMPRDPTSHSVIEHLKTTFSRFGIASVIYSDGDSLYNSQEFRKFCLNYECDHKFSSSRYAQSNGFAERSVQTVKNTIKKCIVDGTDLNIAILNYRNTPLGQGLSSPAVLLFSRNLRTKIPCVEKFLVNKTDLETKKLLQNRQNVADKYYNRTTRNVRPDFKSGDLVVYRDKLAEKIWQQGQIVKAVAPRSYQVVNSNGNIVRRTSRMLLPDKTRTTMSVIPEDHMPQSSRFPGTPSLVKVKDPVKKPVNHPPTSKNVKFKLGKSETKHSAKPDFIPRKSERLMAKQLNSEIGTRRSERLMNLAASKSKT